MTEQPERGGEPTSESDEYVATTVPVRVEIDARQTILRLEEAERILRGANRISLGPCGCRKDNQKCDAPVDVCLTLNHEPEEEFEGFQPVRVEQALEALRRSHQAGLVHLAYRKPGKEITEFCSCCSCCCWFLTKLKATGYYEAIIEAQVAASHDFDRCVGCGTCVERCPFDAWSRERTDAKPSLASDRCFGCGVCVTSCPADAIRLIPRSAST